MKDNLVFPISDLGNHIVQVDGYDLFEKSNSPLWKENDIGNFNSFQEKIIRDRKEIVKYSQEIGE